MFQEEPIKICQESSSSSSSSSSSFSLTTTAEPLRMIKKELPAKRKLSARDSVPWEVFKFSPSTRKLKTGDHTCTTI